MCGAGEGTQGLRSAGLASYHSALSDKFPSLVKIDWWLSQ